MFRTFEQVEQESDEPDDNRSGGLGLGLAVVARVVSQLGGQLRVESKVGQGSKFTFVLHFRLPGPVDSTRRGSTASTASSATNAQQHSGGSTGSGTRDVLIRQVPRAAGSGSDIVRKTSSGGSRKSGQLSIASASRGGDIDSLVEAISSNPGSYDGPRSNRSSDPVIPSRAPKDGQVQIPDSRTPLRSLRIDGNDVDKPQVTGRPSLSTSKRPSLASRKTLASLTGSAVTSRPQVPLARRTSAQARNDSSSSGQEVSEGEESAAEQQARHMRIMIVEDDTINRVILHKKLTKEHKHDVKQTVHGEEAVRMYEQDKDFDFILMDLQ